MVRSSGADLPGPAKKQCCGSVNSIAMTSCKSCDGPSQETVSTWEDSSHVPAVEDFKDWNRSVPSRKDNCWAASSLLQAQHKVLVANSNYMPGLVEEKDEITTVKFFETTFAEEEDEILRPYLLGGFL